MPQNQPFKITIQRQKFTDNSTEGQLYLNGSFIAECYTLEPRKDQSQGKPYCVPAGTYKWAKGFSQHFGFTVVVMEGIPGFTAIEIHPGNFPKDTHGCCLVGKVQNTDYVGQSVAEFTQLLAKLPMEGIIEYIG